MRKYKILPAFFLLFSVSQLSHAQNVVINDFSNIYNIVEKTSPEKRAGLISFFNDIVDYATIAGNSYADGDIALSNGIEHAKDEQLQSIIKNANREANEQQVTRELVPIPSTTQAPNVSIAAREWRNVESPKDESGFHCEIYQTSSGKYVLAFAGTQMERGDIMNDAKGVSKIYGQSMQGIKVAKEVVEYLTERGVSPQDILLTGHSLGGRIAQEASVYTGVPAIVFNSADLSKQSKRLIEEDPAYAKRASQIMKISSGHDLLTNLQGLFPAVVGADVIQKKITIVDGGTHSMKPILKEVQNVANDVTLAEKISSLPQDEQRLALMQTVKIKNDITQAKEDIFKWEAREDLAKEMKSDGAKYAAGIHGTIAAVKKEDAEERLSKALNELNLCENAIDVAYNRALASRTTSTPPQASITFDELAKDYVDNSYKKEPEVQEVVVAEGGHFLSGQIKVAFLSEPDIPYDIIEVYEIKDVKCVLLNETGFRFINKDFAEKIAKLSIGSHHVSEIISNEIENSSKSRGRDEVIPPNQRIQRGL